MTALPHQLAVFGQCWIGRCWVCTEITGMTACILDASAYERKLDYTLIIIVIQTDSFGLQLTFHWLNNISAHDTLPANQAVKIQY